MAYGVKYFCTHKALSGDSGEVTFRIELLEDGFVGSETEVIGRDEVFKLSYDKVDPRNPSKSPIQKGRLEFYLSVEDDSDFSILEDILAADEDKFQLRLKIDGSVYWTGYVLSDLLEFEESDYPFVGTITAKDLTKLAGIDFPLTSDRVTLIQTLAEFLDDVGLGLDINTYTSWITSDTTDTDDFLNQIYNEREAFRNFARNSKESDETITVEEALEKFLSNHRLILRQENNAWNAYQLTALDTPTSVNQFTYDSTGSQTASTTVDLSASVDRSSLYILPSSAEINPGIKTIRVKFDHRTEVSRINEFDFELDDSTTTSDSVSQSIISDGDQSILFWAFCAGEATTDVPSATARYVIKAGSYYWDQDNYEWTENGGVELENTFSLTKTIDKPSIELWSGGVNYETAKLPADADGVLTVKAYIPTNLDEARFGGSININNDIIDGNSTYIDYKITQPNGYSSNFDAEDTWFGDGPVIYSVSALRYSSNDGDITTDSWQRRGTTSGYRNYHENQLKELLDLQRSPKRNINATIWGDYTSNKVIQFANPLGGTERNYFFLGGELTGENRWDSQILEINIETDTDTFDDIPKFEEESNTGNSSDANDTTQSTSGGLDQGTADNRYLNETSNLSDLADTTTSRQNLGVEIGVDVQAYDTKLADFVSSTVSVSGSNISGVGDIDFNASSNGDILIDTDIADFRNLSGGLWITPVNGSQLRIGPSSSGDTFDMLINRITNFEVQSDTTIGGTVDAQAIDINSNTFVDSSRNVTASKVGAGIAPLSSATASLSVGLSGNVNIVMKDTNNPSRTGRIEYNFSDGFRFQRGDQNGDYDGLNAFVIDVDSGAVSSNVIINADAGLKIADNGAGQITDDSGNVHYQHGSVYTAIYVPPSGSHIDLYSTDDGNYIARFNNDLSVDFRGDITISNSTFVDSSRNVTAGAGTFSGNVDITGNLLQDVLSFEFSDRDGGGGVLFMRENPTTGDLEISHNSEGHSFLVKADGSFESVGGYISSSLGIGTTPSGTAGDLTLANDLQKDNFALTTDFSGTGWQGDTNGDFNIRNLVVREAARFRELIIDQLSVIAGSDLRSVARGKIKSVDSANDQIELENPNQRSASSFQNNDFFWVKAIDVDGGTFLDLKGQVTNVDVTSGVITLTLDTTVSGGTHDGGTTDISGLSEGDTIVQRGHPSDTDRQALIYTTVSDSDAPVQKYFTGIDSLAAFDQVASISTQIGVMDGLTSTYSNVTGEGLFSSNAYLTDSVIVGDLSKTSGYLSYDGSTFELNSSAFTLSAGTTADGLIRIFDDNTGLSDVYTGTSAGLPLISVVQGSTTTDRVFAHMGETYSSGWTGRYGLSVGQGKDTDAVFEASVNPSTGAFTGVFAGFDFDYNRLSTGATSTGLFRLYNDNTGLADLYNGTANGTNVITMVQGTTTGNRLFAHIGETYSGAWTGRYGFSLSQGKSSDAIFEVSSDISTGTLTATIAGANFDLSGMWSDNNSNTFKGSGLYIDWIDEDFSLGSEFYYDSSLNEVGLAGFKADSSHFYGGFSGGSYTGLQPGTGTTKAFFAGADDKDGLNSTFSVTANGNLEYDGLVSVLYNAQEVADFTENSDAASITDSEFHTSATTSAGVATTASNTDTKLRLRYYHRFGFNKIILQGKARRTTETSGTPSISNSDGEIELSVGGQSNSTTFANSSTLDVFVEVDVSSLTIDTYYVLEVNTTATITVDSATGSETATCNCFMREDIFVAAAS